MDTKLIWRILEPDRNFWISVSFAFAIFFLIFSLVILLTAYVNWEISRQAFRLFTALLFLSSALMIPLYIEYKKTKF